MSALDTRTAVIIGAGRGIGQAIALRLALLGARTICVARSAGELAQTVRMAGAAATSFVADMSAPDAAQAIFTRVSELWEQLDILVICAGAMAEGKIENTSPESFDTLIRTNLLGPYRLMYASVPLLRASRGQVLVINSSIIRAGNIANRCHYAVTQSALKTLTDGLRDELNRDGIRVISVMPGTTATPRQEKMFEASGRDYRPQRLLQPADVARIACDVLLLDRTAEATDIFLRPMMKD